MQRLHGHRFKRALAAGIEWFSHFRRHVDRINVFPVPDGDTGKNMHHAFQAALKEIQTVRQNNASEVAWAAARGALMGGRGCSGMILSGFFSGFAEGVGDRQALSAEDLARAFQIGCLRARERVEHPQEGTILTVGEAAAREAMAAHKSQQIYDVIRAAWQGAKNALAKTQRQMRVLEEHHVVDAGGQGLVYFFEGLMRYSQRQSVAESATAGAAVPMPPVLAAARPAAVSPYKFCTEFILADAHQGTARVRECLRPLGEHCMVAAGPDATLKVHIHTKDPDAVFAQAERLGKITWRKVDDMEQQHRNVFGNEAEQA